jgi:hypothetical protein
MKKFNLGDKVRPKLSLIRYYLSDEGQEMFYPPSGKLNKEQKKNLERSTKAMLAFAIEPKLYGEVVAHHWPNSTVENYKIEIYGTHFNIEPKNLIKKRG